MIVCIAGTALALALVPGGLAATFTVTTTSFASTGGCDAESCNLTEAIQATHSSPGVDEIDVPNLGAPYVPPAPGLPTLEDVSLVGTGSPGPRIDGQLAGDQVGLLFTGAVGASSVTNVTITGFQRQGIFVAPSQSVTITHSFIGTDPSSTPGLGNGDGIMLNSAGSIVGGATAADGNVISGNGGWGVMLQQATATGNQILRNVIGTSADGSVALPNGSGGIWVLNAPHTVVGGDADGEGNSIGGNTGSGIVIEGASSAGTVVQGNEIGVDQPNSADGIFVGNGVTNVAIGGPGAAANTIRSNAGAGIVVLGSDPPATAVSISGNSIDENGGLGIDLGSDGVTANDPDDSDTGPNMLQNAPEISGVDVGVGAGVTNVWGTLPGIAVGLYRLEFFYSPTCDPSGYGEGRTYFGFGTLNTSGTRSFDAYPSAEAPAGSYVTATATDPNGNTSEFSGCFQVPTGGGGPLTVTTTADSGPGSLRQAILDANAQAGEQTIGFAITVPEVGPKVISLASPLPNIADPVTIDGTTQAGYVASPNTPIVVVDGTSLVESNGLTFAPGAGGSTVRALSLTNFGTGPPYTAIRVLSGANDVGIYRNFIGVRPNGATVGRNGVGILTGGVGTLIGSESAGDANLIVGSHGAAVDLENSGADVRRNEITDLTGVAGSANGVGVLNDGATSTTVEGNTIRGASGDGVQILSPSTDVDVVSNRIWENGGLGINIGSDGVTPNSGDLGPVYWEYFPENLSATSVPGGLQVAGDFNARAGSGSANQDYLIELFRNDACDPSGNGEGQDVLAQLPVTTNAVGHASFSTTVPGTTTGAITATATALDPGSSRATSEFSACFVVGGEPGNVTLDAVQTSVPSTGAVPLASVPGSAFLPTPGATQSSALEGAPISNIPISNIPISNIPISNIPISNIGFTDAAILPLLRVFPLSDLPLLRAGGWPAALAGTAFADTPLQNVSLADALALPSIAALDLTLDDLDLSRARLGELPAVATVLGTVPLSSLPLPGGVDWCSLTGPGVQCSGSSSVLSISIEGAPISNIPISNIPISNIPISNIPISNIPISNIPISNIPISNIPISNIPISNIPISNIAGLIDCTAHPCDTSTLYDAFVGGWFLPTATLGDLLLALPEPNDVTLADVLILLFSSTSTVGWEQLDLDTAGLQAAAAGGNAIDWHADVGITGTAVSATVTLPKGSVFDTTFTPTVQTLPAGAPTPLPPPEIGSDADGNVTLDWSLVGAIGTTARIAFRSYPPLRVGPQSGALEAAAAGGTPATSDPAPFSVTDTFEPNGEGSPQPVDPGSLYLSYITQANDLDFYSLPAPPAGSTIRVFLSHLPADYDLAVYAPADPPLRPAVAGTEQLDSPPLVDTGVPLGSRQEVLSPETLDDLQIDQSRALVGVSANRGTEDDSVVAISGGTGSYLIQVTPYNGATSDDAYMLRVEVDPPQAPLSAAPIAPATGTIGTVPASLPAGTNTLFLWNRSQLTGLYGSGPADSVLAAMQQTQTKLTSLGFPSAIVGVDGNAAVRTAVSAWNADPGDPDKANAVVRTVNAVVDGLRGQANGAGIKYLVLVGGDRAMPFARLEDYVTISNEAGYAQSVGTNNELSAALGAGRLLSDDPYGDTSPVPYLNRQLFVPDLAVGRLVETPSEIVDALARYRDFNGVLDPSTARVAGYDFLSDGAEAVRQALATRQGLSAPAEPTLIGDAWARDDLIAALLPSSGQPPDIASLNGHADHYRLQPPVGTSLFSTGDLTADSAPTLPDRLVFSMGCHAGLSVADTLIAQGLDWPQAYEREGATYLGNTTFGYGDTAVVSYSEELNHMLAEQVASGGPIGDALRLAKNEYFSTRGVFSVYDEKAMAAFTLYGLPMWSIGPVPQTQSVAAADGVQPLARATAPAPRSTASSSATLAIPTTTVGTDPITGLQVERFDASPAFTSVTTSAGTYLRGDSGVQVSHLRPIEPKLVVELGGAQAHGALITGLTSSDQGGVNPVYARPIVDQAANEPELAFNDVAYPSKLLTVRTYLTAAGARQRLVMGTGQFFGNAATVDLNGTGTQRRYTRVAGETYRSTSNDRVAPTFTKIDAFVVSGNAAFSVDVAGGDARRVLAGYRSGSSSVWQFVDLAQGPAGHWSGGGPVAASQFEYFVQVVDEAGNVGVSTNKGFYFDGAPLPSTPPGPLQLDAPTPTGQNGWYTGQVVVGVHGTEGVPLQVSIDGGPFQDPGADGQVSVTGDGVHVVTARDATGETDTVLVPIDGTAPQVVFGTPTGGASYPPGASLPAAYSCIDSGSGATSCAGTVAVGTSISTTAGAHTFTVTTSDRAGNTATRSVTYNVTYRKILFASTRTGLGDIYAVNADGSGLNRLTSGLTPDEEPSWSPDGTRIAFASRRSGLTQDIYVMNADGSNVQRLTTASRDDTAPAWSPDGTRIAFRSTRDGNAEIYVMNADGSGQTRLTNDRKEDLTPTWSPDGSKIAWSKGTLLKADVYTMNANGTGATRIATDASDPDWGVNGKIVFTRSVVGLFVWEIYSMNANGSGVTRLTNVRGPDFDPAWSSDGQKIVFSSGRNGILNLELYVMNADGSGQSRVTTSAGLDRTPDW